MGKKLLYISLIILLLMAFAGSPAVFAQQDDVINQDPAAVEKTDKSITDEESGKTQDPNINQDPGIQEEPSVKIETPDTAANPYASQSFLSGLQSFYDKQFDRSMESFRETLDNFPMDAMSLSFYLDTSYKTNNLIVNVNQLEENSISNDNAPILRAQTGLGYFVRGKLDAAFMDEARSIFRDVLSKQPNLSLANTGMGMVYFQSRLMPRAKGYFINSLKANPNDMMALELLGNIILIDDKNPAEAMKLFVRMQELCPQYSDSYFYIGSAHERQGNTDEAIKYFQKCSDLDPNGVLKGYYAPTRIADIYLDQQKWEDAEKFYKVSLKINPDNPYVKTQMEKAQRKGKAWSGEKVDDFKDRVLKDQD